MSCWPICAYIVKNNYSFLNHIVIRHYWSSFSCGKCLEFATSSGQQMRTHLGNCKGPRRSVKRRNAPNAKCPRHQVVTSQRSHGTSLKPRKTRRRRMISVVQRRRSCMGHCQSLQPQPPLQNTILALHIIVSALLNPILPRRHQRNVQRSHTRSPNRRCTHQYQGNWRCVMIGCSTRHMCKDTKYTVN